MRILSNHFLIHSPNYSNALVDYMVNGTAIKEAIEHGKNLDGDSCDQLYSGCPLDKQQSLKLLTKLLPEA